MGVNHISKNQFGINYDFSENLADPPKVHTQKRFVIKARYRNNLQHLEYCHYTVLVFNTRPVCKHDDAFILQFCTLSW